MTHFQKWVDVFGQAALAKELSVTRQLVNQWVKTETRPSDNLKIKILPLSHGILDYNSFFNPFRGRR